MLTYEQRQALLARDLLACSNGFHTLVLLILRKMFGLRFCPRCPDCATSGQPCMDAFGSNATAAGGVFGKADALYGSLECQKSGAWHLHGQLFVQCTHQFTPLSELARLGKESQLELVRKHLYYTAHVPRKLYHNPEAWHARQKAVEDEWPEYKTSGLMVSGPAPVGRQRSLSAEEWKMQYLAEDVELLQMHKRCAFQTQKAWSVHWRTVATPRIRRGAREVSRMASGWHRSPYWSARAWQKTSVSPTKARRAWVVCSLALATMAAWMPRTPPCWLGSVATVMCSYHFGFRSVHTHAAATSVGRSVRPRCALGSWRMMHTGRSAGSAAMLVTTWTSVGSWQWTKSTLGCKGNSNCVRSWRTT